VALVDGRSVRRQLPFLLLAAFASRRVVVTERAVILQKKISLVKTFLGQNFSWSKLFLVKTFCSQNFSWSKLFVVNTFWVMAFFSQ
jgi:hypothetical protein